MEVNSIETWHYPRLIFTIVKNPNFNNYKILENISQPTLEYYNCCIDDYMTLGRDIPSFDEFSSTYIKDKIYSLMNLTKSEFIINKLPVNNFNEIIEFVNNTNNFVRFYGTDGDLLNAYFSIK